MARPIRIPIISDVADFLRGTKDVEEALDDVVDSLEEVDDAGKDPKAVEGLEDIERAAKDTEDGIDRLERKFRDSMDDVKRQADETGRRVGKDLDDGFDKAKKGADDFKDEAGSSGREAAASFTGEFDDIADAVQEIAANAFSGFGPAGAVAGLAAAAGIGLLTAHLQESQEAAEEAKDRIRDLADQIRDAGGDIRNVDMRSWWREFFGEEAASSGLPWAKSTIDNLEAMQTAAQELGTDVGTLMDALADPRGAEAMDLQAQLADRLGTGIFRVYGASNDTTAALQWLRTELENGNPVIDEAIERYEAEEDALGRVEASQEALREERERGRETLGGLISAENGYYEALQSANEVIETNGANWNAATEEGRANREAVLGSAEAQREYIQSLVDSGAPLEEIRAQQDKLRGELYDQAVQAGATEEEAQRLIDTYLGTPQSIGLDYDFPSQADVDEGLSTIPEVRTVTINGVAHTYQFQEAVDTAAAGLRNPGVQLSPRVGLYRV